MASSASPSETELSRSRAGSLLHGICIHPTLFIAYHAPCGSWLASDGVRPVTSMAPVPPSSLASQLPQVLHSCRNLIATPGPLWELACQRWRPSCHINCACAAVIAGKPAPTGFAFMPQSHCHTWPFVGAGLPAMASFLSHQLRLRRRHRWQASSHRFFIQPVKLTGTPAPTRICIHRHVVVAPASTAPAVPVPVRWSRAASPITRRCCRRRRSRGTGNPPGLHYCRRRSGS
ncbi:hypothetical protein D3C71_171320 [compost metagenome]